MPPFSFVVPEPRVEPTPRWVRVRAGDTWIADSREASLVVWYGPGRLPTYLLPPSDVRLDLLRPSPSVAASGLSVPHDVVVGERVIEGAAHLLVDPDPRLAEGRGLWTFTWDGRLSWFEEATEVRLHARDPSHRVDVVPSERHIRIELGGELLAESRRPCALFETSLPTRWYLPADDVRPGALQPSATTSGCPYKGSARYFSARLADRVVPDVAWTYPEPVPECPGVAGLVCFFDERVDVTIDGERQERPRTPWSPGGPEVSPA